MEFIIGESYFYETSFDKYIFKYIGKNELDNYQFKWWLLNSNENNYMYGKWSAPNNCLQDIIPLTKKGKLLFVKNVN